jgi:hypothetical protein
MPNLFRHPTRTVYCIMVSLADEILKQVQDDRGTIFGSQVTFES